MKEIFLTLAEKVSPCDVIFFLVIAFQERSFARKDNQFEKISNGLINELHENSNQLTQLTAIVNFLAFNREYTHDENKDIPN